MHVNRNGEQVINDQNFLQSIVVAKSMFRLKRNCPAAVSERNFDNCYNRAGAALRGDF